MTFDDRMGYIQTTRRDWLTAKLKSRAVNHELNLPYDALAKPMACEMVADDILDIVNGIVDGLTQHNKEEQQ